MALTKILVVEDDPSILELICMNLEAAGYQWMSFSDGDMTEAFLKEKDRPEKEEEIALAIVDIMLPGKDGFALMEDFQRKKIPVIYLTARADVDSKVRGLKGGAEDYMVKPFEIRELLARVEKVLERTGRMRQKLVIRDMVIDREKHVVTQNGKEVLLKPMEYELLLLLAQYRNVAFSREELIKRLWGTDYLGESRTIDVHIGRLRKKLKLYDSIKTIPKIGYRLEDLP